ncbi:MAG: hypothetical protein WD187_00230 [Candidatus Woykebacteria bacterium]
MTIQGTGDPAKREEILFRAWQREQNLLAMELTFLLKVAYGQQECDETATFSKPFVFECYWQIKLAKDTGGEVMARVCRDVVETFIAHRLHPKLAILATHL